VSSLLQRLSYAVATGAGEATDKTFWLPRGSSNLAQGVDFNWNLVYWLSAFFFVLVTTLMAIFVWRYRGKPGQRPQPSSSHNNTLEIVWTVIPTLLVVVLFWSGYRSFLDMVTPPQDAYEVQVEGQKWNWLFRYKNGYVDNNLHVEVGRPTTLVMTSKDVIHSFFVPEFRVKRDVIPGRYSKLWFTALETGEFDVFCAEYCGTDHSTMLSKVVVHEVGEYDAWLREASDFLNRMSPVEAGEMLYNVRGCSQCHSVDGSSGTGPTFLGLYGSQERLATGDSVLVDENYVRQSILTPQAQVTAGYEPVMPTFEGQISEEQLLQILAYIKSLSGKEAPR
jgi:cytochrome c oxidase subunit 2